VQPGGGIYGEGFVGKLTDVVLYFDSRGDVIIVAGVVSGLPIGVVCRRWHEERVQVAEEALDSHRRDCRRLLIRILKNNLRRLLSHGC